MRPRVLIVDDETRIRQVLKRYLGEKGMAVTEARDGASALRCAEDDIPDIVLLDLRMPGQNGMDVLKELLERGIAGKVIIMTAYGSIRSAVEAIKEGAYDYITKPFSIEEVFLIVRRALEHSSLERELKNARDQLRSTFSLSGIVAASPTMISLLETVRRVARTNTPVFISGESGTGKELIAKAIHQESPRRSKPFVAINCSSIPATLLESELFGYRRGAFSGAERAKAGLVETADQGTLFLDEVSEMSEEAQAKLLRFSQSGEFFPLGGTATLTVDVRLIAATNRDLESRVKSGRFREDLYYRLKVFHLHVPPLRERREDIPLLIDFFLRKHGEESEKKRCRFDRAAIEAMLAYDWPGNVRELENAVRSALAITESRTITRDLLPLSGADRAADTDIEPSSLGLNEALRKNAEAVERRIIRTALSKHSGNRTRAAEELGICRTTLIKKIRHYGL